MRFERKREMEPHDLTHFQGQSLMIMHVYNGEVYERQLFKQRL